jgi:hypothetical protein
MAIDDNTTRAEWMESARRRLVESQQLGAELLGKWEFMTNEERLGGLTLVESKLNDCIIMVRGRTVFKNGD